MDTLFRVAEAIPIRQRPCNNRYRLAAAVVKRGDIIAIGINSLKSHPLQSKYSKHPDAIFLHAEVAAIKNALKRVNSDELESCDLYVCRVKFDSSRKNKLILGDARPCSGCEKCIIDFGIKNTFYSCDNGNIQTLYS